MIVDTRGSYKSAKYVEFSRFFKAAMDTGSWGPDTHLSVASVEAGKICWPHYIVLGRISKEAFFGESGSCPINGLDICRWASIAHHWIVFVVTHGQFVAEVCSYMNTTTAVDLHII